MKSSVLDSYAVLAFLFKESGYEKILNLVEKASELDQVLLVTSPNWAEVRYQVERKLGRARWDETRPKLLVLPIEVVAVDRELAEMAGESKVIRKMSLAECFAAALARQRKLDLYTGDPEFKAVEKEIKVVWI